MANLPAVAIRRKRARQKRNSEVELKNQQGAVFYDKLKFIYIELPKFRKEEDQLETHFDKWLYVFTHLSRLQARPKL